MRLIRRTLSAGHTGIALLASCVLLGPAFAEATTLNVSGEYSSSFLNPPAGTFSGTITTNGNNINDVDIAFPVVSDFTYVADSLPAGNNWDLTAASLAGLELDLVFSTTPIPGSLAGFTGGSIVSGQVIDPEGGFTLFQGFSGSISPALTSASPVPEPSSQSLLALGFTASGFAAAKAALKRNLRG